MNCGMMVLISTTALAQTSVYVPITPCRAVDTRGPAGPTGAPSMGPGSTRIFPLAGACGLPTTPPATAYAFNVTVVPSAALGYLTIWPTGYPQPTVSTINAPTGLITANAAIITAGPDGSVSVFASAATDLVLDVNGYYQQATPPPPTPISYQGNWTVLAIYAQGDVILFNGSSYMSLQGNNSGAQPDMNPAWWGMMAAAGAPGAQGPPGQNVLGTLAVLTPSGSAPLMCASITGAFQDGAGRLWGTCQ